MATPVNWLPLSLTREAARAAARQGVSEVARSPRGFLAAYGRAGGDVQSLSDYWYDRRNGFVARHMAQVRKHGELLWKDGAPTRRHLALAVWAYSPTPKRLETWLRAR